MPLFVRVSIEHAVQDHVTPHRRTELPWPRSTQGTRSSAGGHLSASQREAADAAARRARAARDGCSAQSRRAQAAEAGEAKARGGAKQRGQPARGATLCGVVGRAETRERGCRRFREQAQLGGTPSRSESSLHPDAGPAWVATLPPHQLPTDPPTILQSTLLCCTIVTMT